MSFYTSGRVVTDAITAWASSEGLSIFGACDKLGVSNQSFYGWAHGKRVTHRIVQRIEAVIGPVKETAYPVPEGKLLVDADKFNQLVDNVLDAHRSRESHIDIAIAVACAKGCVDAIIDLQEQEMVEVKK
jgi:hypothetical protein